MVPLPDCTTKAWLVAGSTATPPKRFRFTILPLTVTGTVAAPDPGRVIWPRNVCAWPEIAGSGLVRQDPTAAIQAKAYLSRVTGFEIETWFCCGLYETSRFE